MLSYEKIEEKYKKRIKDLFEHFLRSGDEHLTISEERYQGIYDTVHCFSDNKDFNKNLYKALDPHIYHKQNEFHIDKKTLFKLIPALYVEHYYMWHLNHLLFDETIEHPAMMNDWDDISEDFRSAFERFYKGWDKCNNEKYQFEYAEDLFRVIYEEYPELCTEAFPIVLFIFTDSYFDFCKICREDQRDIPEELSDEMRSNIVSLFIDRISGEDFQYYLFSLIDVKPGYYSESSFDQAKILYDTLIKKISKKMERSVNNPDALHVKYKDLLDLIGSEYNERLDALNKKYKHLMMDAYRRSQNPLKDFPIKREHLYKNLLDECKKELADIIKKYINHQNNLTDKAEAFWDEVEALFADLYNQANESFYVSYEDRMKTRQEIKELIKDIILKKYDEKTKKNIETMRPCKNFEAIWRFMHDFSSDNGINNHWVNYDMDFTLYVLNNATGWIDCMTISAEKDIPFLSYPYHINLHLPFTSHHMISIIRSFFNTVPHDHAALDLETYDTILEFYGSALTLYHESQKDCDDIFNDSTFDKNMPDDFFDIMDYYDEVFGLSHFPSIEDITSLLAEYILWLFE